LSGKEILNSWKEISQYLQHDERTCRRWEKSLGLPVRRYDDDSSRSRVFALKSELDEWFKQRKNNHNHSIKTQEPFFKSKRTPLLLFSIAVTTAVFIGLLTGLLGKLWQGSPEGVSIGIYPFTSSHSSGYDDYLAQGITNEIFDYLALFENLKITKLAALPNAQEEEFFNNHEKAEYLLNGDLQNDGDVIKFRFNLVKAKNNKIVINHEVRKKYADIQLIKVAVARKIHSKLNIPFNNQTAESFAKSSISQEPYDLCLKGNYILNSIKNSESDPWKLYHKGKYYYGLTTRESNEVAIELFCAAIDLDETFSYAYTGLAQCYLNYINFLWDDDIQWLNKAESLLNKAESFSSDYPQYYCALIKLYLLEYLGFEKETDNLAFDAAKKGIEKFPENPDLNIIASYCYYIRYGREQDAASFIKALEYGQKSFWGNPFSINNLFFTELLLLDGQFSKALDTCNVIKRASGSSLTDFRIGEIHYYMGNLEVSKSIFSQIRSPLYLEVGALYYLGMIAAQNKNLEKVQNILSKLENLSRNLLDDHLRLSSIYFGIGDSNKGFGYLDNFFNNQRTQKIKYNYKKYISLDKNYDGYRLIIWRKYYE